MDMHHQPNKCPARKASLKFIEALQQVARVHQEELQQLLDTTRDASVGSVPSPVQPLEMPTLAGPAPSSHVASDCWNNLVPAESPPVMVKLETLTNMQEHDPLPGKPKEECDQSHTVPSPAIQAQIPGILLYSQDLSNNLSVSKEPPSLESNQNGMDVRAAFSEKEELKTEIRNTSHDQVRQYIANATNAANITSTDLALLSKRTSHLKYFRCLSCFVVLMNMLWIPIYMDTSEAELLADAAWHVQLFENCFCTFYCIEWLYMFQISRRKGRLILRDVWFVFNSFLVIQVVFETWVLYAVPGVPGVRAMLKSFSVLRLFRLVRLTHLLRFANIFQDVPELQIMFKAFVKSARASGATASFILIILYIFGILLKLFSDGTEMGAALFPNVPLAMYHLFVHATLLDDVADALNAVRNESTFCMCLFLLVILLAGLTLMNMMVGVLCDVMSRMALEQEEDSRVVRIKGAILQVLTEFLDYNGDGLVSKSELKQILRHPKAVRALCSVGVDVEALVDFADFIFQSDEQGKQFERRLNFDEFMSLVLQLRGTNPATVRDVVDLQQFIHEHNNLRNMKLATLEAKLNEADIQRGSIYHKLDNVHEAASGVNKTVAHLKGTVESTNRKYDRYLASSTLKILSKPKPTFASY